MPPRSTRRWRLADYKNFAASASATAPAAASCGASASRAISRPAASLPRRRSARSAPASACGNRPRCASTRPAPSRCSPARTATARATRPRSRSSCRTGSAFPIDQVTIVHGDTDKVQFGMGTYGSRSGAVGMSAIAKALDKVDRQGQEGRRPRARGVRGRHRVQGRQVRRRRHRPLARPSAKWRCRPISPTSSRARSSSPA